MLLDFSANVARLFCDLFTIVFCYFFTVVLRNVMKTEIHYRTSGWVLNHLLFRSILKQIVFGHVWRKTTPVSKKTTPYLCVLKKHGVKQTSKFPKQTPNLKHTHKRPILFLNNTSDFVFVDALSVCLPLQWFRSYIFPLPRFSLFCLVSSCCPLFLSSVVFVLFVVLFHLRCSSIQHLTYS